MDRVRAYVKRLVQSLSFAQVPLICGSLFLLGELCNQRPGLWPMVTQPEEFDQDQAPTAEGEAQKINTSVYDGRKREPLFANASQSCLWELIPFSNHFHPSVALYAKTILSGSSLVVPKDATNYEPLLNHTLARFLDRFVYKAPKKVKSLNHGTSLMQPRGQANILLAGGRKKMNAMYEDEDKGGVVALDDAPVNMSKWESADQVPADEVCFFKYSFNKIGVLLQFL